MGKAKRARKVTRKKGILSWKDERLKQGGVSAGGGATAAGKRSKKKKKDSQQPTEIVEPNSSLFFQYNLNLGPPYQIIVDTNFVNFSIQHKLDLHKGMMDCLLAKCIPCVTDCVVGELEKMGHRFRLALQLVKDSRCRRLSCSHKGTYADDCIVDRVQQHRCYIVATNDKDLKRRIRKIPGVPLLTVAKKRYVIERLPDAVTSVPANVSSGGS